MFLVYHVISQDHLTKRWSNIMRRSRSRLVNIPPSLVAIGLWQWKYNGFRLSRDLVVIKLPASCWIYLNWVNSPRCACLPNLVVIGLMEMEMSILISVPTWAPWKNMNSPPRSAKLTGFQNQEYRLTIPNSQTRLAEKREEEEEEEEGEEEEEEQHRQLQSIMRFTQTQE